MTASFDVPALILLLVALVNATLGALVLWRSRHEQNVSFALTAIFVALWALTNSLFRLASTVFQATLWAQLAYVAALGTGATLLHFAWSFPLQAGSRFARASVWLTGLLVSILVFVPGAVIRHVDVAARRIETAPGIYLLALFLFVTLLSALGLFWHNQTRLRGRRRAQARLVLYGCALTALFGLTFNLVLPLTGDYRWVWMGPTSSLFFVGCSAYAIVAKQLFDVRLLVRRTFVYSFLLAALAGTFAVLEKGMEHLLLPLLGAQHSFSSDLVAALFVGFAADPLKRWLRHVASARLFQGEEADEELMHQHV